MPVGGEEVVAAFDDDDVSAADGGGDERADDDDQLVASLGVVAEFDGAYVGPVADLKNVVTAVVIVDLQPTRCPSGGLPRKQEIGKQ
jgi:hypothetical protein